jgi:hypothetical protein
MFEHGHDLAVALARAAPVGEAAADRAVVQGEVALSPV